MKHYLLHGAESFLRS